MSDSEEVCVVCGEPRSAHVATVLGPLTHPREARGEGCYRRIGGGSYSAGLNCSRCPGGICDGHAIEPTWEFVPAPRIPTFAAHFVSHAPEGKEPKP